MSLDIHVNNDILVSHNESLLKVKIQASNFDILLHVAFTIITHVLMHHVINYSQVLCHGYSLM